MRDEGQVLLEGDADAAPSGAAQEEAQLLELEELQGLIADGHDRGYVTIEGIANALEDYEVSKEQIGDLYAYLEEHGIELLGAEAASAAEAAKAEVPERADADPVTAVRGK